MLHSTVANRPDLKPDLKILGQEPAPMRSLKQMVSLEAVANETIVEPVPTVMALGSTEDDAKRLRTMRRPLKRTLVVIDRPAPAFVSSPRERREGERQTLAERASAQLRNQRRSMASAPARPVRVGKAATAAPTVRTMARVALKHPLKLAKRSDPAPKIRVAQESESLAATAAPDVAVAPAGEPPAMLPTPAPVAVPTQSASVFERFALGLRRWFAKT